MKLATPKKYLNVHLIFFIAITAITIVSLSICYAATNKTIHPLQEKVCVKPGQTLWGIVEDNYPGISDVRVGVEAIEQRNGITAADLKVGHTYYLPEVK